MAAVDDVTVDIGDSKFWAAKIDRVSDGKRGKTYSVADQLIVLFFLLVSSNRNFCESGETRQIHSRRRNRILLYKPDLRYIDKSLWANQNQSPSPSSTSESSIISGVHGTFPRRLFLVRVSGFWWRPRVVPLSFRIFREGWDLVIPAAMSWPWWVATSQNSNSPIFLKQQVPFLIAAASSTSADFLIRNGLLMEMISGHPISTNRCLLVACHRSSHGTDPNGCPLISPVGNSEANWVRKCCPFHSRYWAVRVPQA